MYTDYATRKANGDSMLTVWLKSDDRRALDAVSQRTKLSRTQVCVRALRRYFQAIDSVDRASLTSNSIGDHT